MSDGGGSLLPVSGEDAPGVAWADTHQGGGLIQCHVLREHAVQNLYPSLLSLRQCHFLHCDIFAGQLVRTFSLNNDTPLVCFVDALDRQD